VETLIELALLAVAAYGIKNYFFTPEIVKDKEVVSTRGATLVKKLIGGQSAQGSDIQTSKTAQNRAEPVADREVKVDTETNQAQAAETVETPISNLAASDDRIAIKQTITVPSEKSDRLVPEDSVLKRHYWAQLAAEQAAIKNPYPTDSVLRRHYEQKQIASLNLTITEAATGGSELTDVSHESIQMAPVTPKKVITIPEDSVLKRHFLSSIRHEIESQNPPRPTDAVLKRHYKQLIDNQIAAYLAKFA
jgi:signal transduction histidine kinase